MVENEKLRKKQLIWKNANGDKYGEKDKWKEIRQSEEVEVQCGV